MSSESEIEALEREAAEKEAKEAAQQKPKKKNKTANKLDERFQLTDKHDPEHIFPEEHDMVAQLRTEIPDLRFYSDKWIVYFLCARRHEMSAVKELLVKYLKMREEYGWRHCLPDIHTDSHKEMRNDKLMYHMPGMIDNQGRLVMHFYLARSRPHGRPLAHMLAYAMWEVDYLVETETLAHLRNGTIWVCNMEGFSIMKNLDMSADGRKWSSTVSGSFPNRIRGAWIIRTGWLARAILAAGKVLFPKKIAKRFATVKDSDLVNMAPKWTSQKQYDLIINCFVQSALLKDLGGDVEPDFEKMFALHDEVTKKLEKRWKKVRKELRAENRDAEEKLSKDLSDKASLKSSKKKQTESVVS